MRLIERVAHRMARGNPPVVRRLEGDPSEPSQLLSGPTTIPDTTLAALVRETALNAYGIVAVGTRRATLRRLKARYVPGLQPRPAPSWQRLPIVRPGSIIGRAARWLVGSSPMSKGVVVRVENGKLVVDLSVVTADGLPPAVLARNLSRTVRFRLEQFVGLPVGSVNVRVVDTTHSDPHVGSVTAAS